MQFFICKVMYIGSYALNLVSIFSFNIHCGSCYLCMVLIIICTYILYFY